MNEDLICPYCKDKNIIYDTSTGDVICSSCGLVIEHHLIDQGAEWRAFNTEEKDRKSRVGAPTTLTIHDKGLSTIIDWRDKDAQGKKLSPKRRAEASRLRKWQLRMRVHSSIDRNLAYAMNELDRLASQIDISKQIKETSALIYRRAIERNLIRGRSIESMMAASIYTACRIRKIPITIDELSMNSRIDKKELGRCYRLLLWELGIKIPSRSPKNFVSRFVSELCLSSNTQRRALIILNKARKIGLIGGKDPSGMAAASIYVAAIQEGEKRTQREIASIAKITEVTVRNRYKELINKLNLKVSI
ncbi:MAG: transcription initiation factor IIB [Candidatus Lokiarchaeota archaeon]|nr:transcription initiation factor IIB [Candidatus Lokiarchaeota archaeon]